MCALFKSHPVRSATPVAAGRVPPETPRQVKIFPRGSLRSLSRATGVLVGLLLGGGDAALAATCPSNACNLTVTGTVTATSCDVDTGSQVINVDLGSIGTGTFQGVGDVSSPRLFRIKLTGCTNDIAGGNITFQGTADSANSDLLQLTQGSGVATGVAVQILDGTSGQAIPLNQVVPTKSLSAGNNELSYGVRYKSTSASVTPGQANTVMYFNLDYQ